MTRAARLALGLALVVVALAPRVLGIGWGLPNSSHHFSYHPDEYNVLRALGAMDPGHLDFNPRYFHNPTLYYYACGLAYGAARAIGVMPALDRTAFHDHPDAVARFYLLGRGLSVACGVLTALVVYVTCRRRASRGLALLAFGVVAWSPAHVVLSQYMDVDAMLGLAAAVVLWLTAPRPAADVGGIQPVVAGLVAGLGTAVKYNGLLLLVPVVVAILTSPGPGRGRRVLLAGVAAAAAFLVATPYALLDHRGFAAGIRYVLEARLSGRWSDLGHGATFPLTQTWPWLFGEVGLALCLLGLAVGLARHPRAAAPPASLAAAVYLSAAVSGTDYVRYSVASLPALAVSIGFLGDLTRRPLARGAVTAAGILALGVAGLRSGALVALMRGTDVRDAAAAHLTASYPHDTPILLPSEPYFHSPGRLFTDFFYRGRSPAWRAPNGYFQVDSAGWDAARIGTAQLVVVSEHELLYPATDQTGTARFMATLTSAATHREIARFNRPATSFGGLRLEAPLPPAGWIYDPVTAARIRDARLPHDLKYLNPAVLVWALAPFDGPTQAVGAMK